MCGIAGFVDFNVPRVQTNILNRMVQCLARRGPDAHGTLVDGACGLAHTRLSILDLSGSRQPMKVPESDISLIYNGEIYNYVDLRSELQAAGDGFRTTGDTEVLLQGLSRHWHTLLSRLNGMFAFAAWDRRRECLLLARDPIGEKPLFYALPEPGVLVFGSEAKAVLEHPGVERRLNIGALRQSLRFNAVYGGQCLYGGIRQLEPGAFMEFRRSGVIEGRFYHLIDAVADARARSAQESDEDLVRRGRELFARAVQTRLVADVPVGAFLSGGLDSSTILAAMREVLGRDTEISSFSVGFEGDAHDETRFAKTVADHVGSIHRTVSVGPDCIERRLAELSECNDAPVHPGAVAIAEVSRISRQWIKVALSGGGADEVFAGYPKYVFANFPAIASTALRVIGPAKVARMSEFFGLDAGRAGIAFRALSLRREVDRMVQWFSPTSCQNLRDLLPGLDWTDATWSETTATQELALSRMNQAGPLCRMQTVDCLTWLPSNLLASDDRMSMAEGVEMRPPFLDKDLVAFGLALPNRLKVQGRVGKWMLRVWAEKLLPIEILLRKKWGFKAPLAEWFRGSLCALASDYITSARGLCDAHGNRLAISRLIDSHRRGEADWSATLWALLSSEVWYQEVFRGRRKLIPPN
jgi:asparagine synthase (glutamine-hydrolysing)